MDSARNPKGFQTPIYVTSRYVTSLHCTSRFFGWLTNPNRLVTYRASRATFGLAMTESMKGPRPRPVTERLTAGLKRKPNGCLEWTGATDSGGYGVIIVGSRTDGTRRLAQTHRLAWTLANGPIPPGRKILHRCDNPPCCDVEGCLFMGTQAENIADMVAKGRNVVSRGEAHGKAKLTLELVALARSACAAGVSQSAVARAFGVASNTIHYAVNGTTWSRHHAN